MLEVKIDGSYGLVILVAVMNWCVLFWQALQVGKARKKFNVKYPTMYENKEPSKFNEVQRAHQNSLEWNTGFLTFLFVSGLTTPITSSAAGVLYNVGRIYYANGYYGGSAHEGLWGMFGLLYLLGASVYTAIKLLRS